MYLKFGAHPFVTGIYLSYFLCLGVTFSYLGLPTNAFDAWVTDKIFCKVFEPNLQNEKPLKNKEIMVLSDYSSDPGDLFWSKFPFNPLPNPLKPNTPIKAQILEDYYNNNKSLLNESQRMFTENTIHDLKHGADSLVDFSLITDLTESNGKGMFKPEIGKYFTDQMVSFIKKKFISGPFIEKPFPNLRVNSLFAVEQKDKYRPILNLSAPVGNSFNEAIPDSRMTRVIMSSPIEVACKIFSLGPGSILSKIDHSSAYKLIPTNFDHLFLQGFYWLDRYFVETSQIFGARSSVPNYDRFHKSFSDLVAATTNIDPYFLARQLDDQIVITPTMDLNEKFVNEYTTLAGLINLPLAPTDVPDKAFCFKQQGVILGVHFDTISMTWAYPQEKVDRHMNIIATALSSHKISLKLMQKILGIVNTITLLCPSLKFLKAPLILDLQRALFHDPIVISRSTNTTLNQYLFIFESLKQRFPIPARKCDPPPKCVTFVTDAAGALKCQSESFPVGIGAVGYVSGSNESLQYVAQCLWPNDFINNMRDDKGKSFGNKTTLLEAIGLLIPIYHNFGKIKNKHVVLFVDNIATVWAYENGRSRKDPYTSVIISALNHIAVSAPCKLYVKHLPRVSTYQALLADILSRQNDKGLYLFNEFKDNIQTSWPPSLQQWFSSPNLDWFLGKKLLVDCLEFHY